MASRRSADSLLARLVKVASAGALLPALAVVLALAGCGGEDSSEESAATTAGATAGAGAGEGSPGKATGSGTDKAGDTDAEQGGQPDSGVAQPEGEPEPGITPQQRRNATTVSMKLSSPAFATGKPLPTTYTCEGADSSPPLSWSGVPEDATELVLLALNLKPVDEALFFGWAVAGLDPGLTSIGADEVPSGAVVGKNSFGKRGYSICPPGDEETYIFMLYALPEALDLKPGFDPLTAREAALEQSGNVGLLSTTYARK